MKIQDTELYVTSTISQMLSIKKYFISDIDKTFGKFLSKFVYKRYVLKH